MNIKKIFFSFFLLGILVLFWGLGGCSSDEGDKQIYLSGLIDFQAVSVDNSKPIIVAVSRSEDLKEIEADPFHNIIISQTVDFNDPYYYLDLSLSAGQVGETVYILAFIDNDYHQGIPYPNLGDFIGFYLNSATKKSSYFLKEGQNRGLDIKIDRLIKDFEATIFYAIDKGEVEYSNLYPFMEIQEIIMAVHEAGVVITMDPNGEPNFVIDSDYILGVTSFIPPVYDHDDLETDRPEPFENPRELKISSAIHVNVPVENNKITGGVYLLAIIDENHDGEIDPQEDKVGYLNKLYRLNVEECLDIPFLDEEVCLPAGRYYYPEPIEVSEGENKEEDGEPYWLMFNFSDLIE